MATSPLPPEWLDRVRLGAGGDVAENDANAPADGSLRLGIRSLDAALPDGGLPRRGVVELCAPAGLGKLTELGLATCRASQRVDAPSSDSSRPSVDELAWCAWLDPTGTLYAPGVAQRGVALSRLLVVRPDPADVARVAVRLVASGIFAAVIVDRTTLPGVTAERDRQRWSLAVRRLALASEQHACTIVLLSDLAQAQREALPTRMRLEITRPRADRLRVHLAKERRGRLVPPFDLALSELHARRDPVPPVELAACRPDASSHSTGTRSTG